MKVAQARRDQLTIVERPKLAQSISEYALDCQARNLSPRTVEYYREELAYFRDYLDKRGVADVAQMDASIIRAYLSDLATTRNAGGCAAMHRAIRAFMRWYATEHDAPQVAAIITKVRAPKVSTEPLEPASLTDIKAMLATCEHDHAGQRDRALIMALLDSGLRASEFVALDVGDSSSMARATSGESFSSVRRHAARCCAICAGDQKPGPRRHCLPRWTVGA